MRLDTQTHRPSSTEAKREVETTTKVAAQRANESYKMKFRMLLEGENVSQNHQQLAMQRRSRLTRPQERNRGARDLRCCSTIITSTLATSKLGIARLRRVHVHSMMDEVSTATGPTSVETTSTQRRNRVNHVGARLLRYR